MFAEIKARTQTASTTTTTNNHPLTWLSGSMTRNDRRAYSVLPFPPLTLTAVPMLIVFLPWPLLPLFLLDAVIIFWIRDWCLIFSQPSYSAVTCVGGGGGVVVRHERVDVCTIVIQLTCGRRGGKRFLHRFLYLALTFQATFCIYLDYPQMITWLTSKDKVRKCAGRGSRKSNYHKSTSFYSLSWTLLPST